MKIISIILGFAVVDCFAADVFAIDYRLPRLPQILTKTKLPRKKKRKKKEEETTDFETRTPVLLPGFFPTPKETDEEKEDEENQDPSPPPWQNIETPSFVSTARNWATG